jgi:acyl-CoA thioesterase I
VGWASHRVAAVGDSITWGSGLADRERDSYPAQLGRLLGDPHEVRNFGVNGTTLLRNGDRPYWTTSSFDAARAFAPDVVVIMLGTNDAKPQNWRHREEFVADYVAMIDAFAALPSRPTIWVCHPVPTFGAYGVRDPVLRNHVIPMIDRVAEVRQVPVIDLYAVLRGRGDLFPNGIHPNAEGARLIAETVRQAIRKPGSPVAPGSRVRPPQPVLVDRGAGLDR